MSDDLQLEAPKKKKKGLLIIIGSVLILLVAAGAWYWNYYNTMKAEKQYKAYMALFLLKATTTAAKAEGMVNQYKDVWNAAIFDDNYTTSDGQNHPSYMGFSQAISDQQSAFDQDGSNSELKKDISSIDDVMSKLKNPPAKYKDQYHAAVDLYSTLSSFTNLATDPSGSLQSYSNDANNMDSDLAKKIQTFKVQLPN